MRLPLRIAVAIAPTFLAGTGCAGHARVHVVPLGTKRIDTASPLIVTVTPDQCYFWINEQEELCVAMRSFSGSMMGKRFEKEFLLSLVAKGVPAGSGREYRMDRRTARVRHDVGYGHTRSASLSGILAVWDYPRNQLRGRFRFTAKQQSYSVLTDWTGNNPVLYLGEFTAVKDRVRGERLLSRTEESAMGRETPQGRAATR
jgi:hypothetical protein